LKAPTRLHPRPIATRHRVPLAAIQYDSGFLIDDFVAAIAARLRADGFHVGGVIQENGGDACAAMTLVDVVSDARFGISQDLGTLASSCRLDPRGLAAAGTKLERATDENIDIMIVNKFGRAEAEAETGGGLRSTFAHAIALGIPVLTAVRPPYDDAWAKFHGGLAAELPARSDDVIAWCHRAIRNRRGAAAPVPSTSQ